MLDNKIQANKNFVNSRFTKYHNRDANQDELNQYSGKGLFDVDKAVGAGANTAKLPTAPKLPETNGMRTGDISSSLPEPTSPNIEEVFRQSSIANLKTQKTNIFNIYKDQKETAQKGIDEQKKIIADQQAEQERLIKESDPNKQPYKAQIDNITQDKLNAAETASATIEGNYIANQNSVTELETLLNQAQAEIEAEQNRPSLSSISQGRVFNIKTDYAGRVGVIQAVMSARTGQINMANTLIDNAFKTVNAQRQDQIAFTNVLLSFSQGKEKNAEDAILTLSAEEKKAMENQISMVEKEMTEAEETKVIIQDLMANKETAEVAEKAGISLADSRDEVAKKLQKYFIDNPEEAEELTLEQKLKLHEKGLIMDTNGNIKEKSETFATNLSIGSGTITGLNGSEYWKWGLDFVLTGGKGAEVKSPFIGEVVEVGENGGFGNQVKIRTASGEEIWLSHLDKTNVKVGDQVNTETVIGTQGNTGNVYSTNGGDGTHLDITMKKSNGDFYTAPEVAELLGYKETEKEVSDSDYIAATQLMTKMTKGKGTTEYKEKVLDRILGEVKKGKTLDEIEDELRYSSVSKEFVGTFKGAFEFITKKGFSMQDREAAKDGLDELLSDGDIENAKYYMMGLARDKATSEEKKQVTGREEALLAIEEIENALNRYVEKGGETGLISGNVEMLQEKILKRTGSDELAQIANEVAVAIQTYRHAVSGAAFTEAESKEYEAIYPNIKNSKELNAAKITSIRNIYERNQTNFYKMTMGAKYFNELFAEEMGSDDPLGFEDDPLGVL